MISIVNQVFVKNVCQKKNSIFFSEFRMNYYF